MTDSTMFRVQKRQVHATITLANGQNVRGCFFLSESSADHAGPERVDELLNASERFVPFQLDTETGPPRVTLYNRTQIVLVHLPESEVALAHDPSYNIARPEPASLLLSNGDRLSGEIHVVGLTGHARLSDFTNLRAFIYFEKPNQTVIVSLDHVIELVPLSGAPERSNG